jgi:hypothetical protein
LYFSLRNDERLSLKDKSKVALIKDSALPSVKALDPINAWYNLCSLANSDFEKY